MAERFDDPERYLSKKLTKDGEIFGSPLYMSPEQCRGALLDHRTDVYATGIMLYETLTGKMPLVGSSFFDTMQMHISTPAKPFSAVVPQLKLSPSLEAVVFRAIKKKPEERYQSMGEFLSALQNVKRQLGLDGGTANANTDQKPVLSKNTALLPIVIGAILMCAVAAYLTSKSSTPPKSAPNEFIKGTIWFYDPVDKPGVIWIYNRSNGLRTIYTGDSRLENTTADAVKTIRNGAEWGVTFHGVNEMPTLEEKGTKFTGTFDKDIVAVDTLIREHYEEMASGEYEKAYKEFSPLFVNLPPEKKLIEDWQKTKWKKGCSHAPITAIKFMAQTQVSITAQVVASYFLEGAHENWSIVFSKDRKAPKTENPWKFQSLDWLKASEATDAQ